jgi:hypothetical protein
VTSRNQVDSPTVCKARPRAPFEGEREDLRRLLSTLSKVQGHFELIFKAWRKQQSKINIKASRTLNARKQSGVDAWTAWTSKSRIRKPADRHAIKRPSGQASKRIAGC